LLSAEPVASRWNQAAKTLFAVTARDPELPGRFQLVAERFHLSER